VADSRIVAGSRRRGVAIGPDAHPAARPFKSALVDDGIPFTSFGVDDIQQEYDRLVAAGVVFTQPPVSMGPVTTAVLDDTCGNLIQIAQMN
jgi:predicted enzyme related to lactoylglutathione lyase